jgi:hypothetical protein
MPDNLAMPTELAKRKQLSFSDWELLGFCITPRREDAWSVKVDPWINATIRPLTQSVLRELSTIVGACFLLRGHLFEIVDYYFSPDCGVNGGVLDIEARCIWILPSAENIFKVADEAASKSNARPNPIPKL